MSKVITFSRVFPKGHPREGQQTYFVEQIWNSLRSLDLPVPKNSDLPKDFLWSILPLSNYGCKHHTIRAGNRFKEGEIFSPRVWSGNPYNSKQIVIAPDIKIKKVFDFNIDIDGEYKVVMIDNWAFYEENSRFVTQEEAFQFLAKNDGLSVEDFKSWFNWGKKPFQGQIICWNDQIEY